MPNAMTRGNEVPAGISTAKEDDAPSQSSGSATVLLFGKSATAAE
jgi:hypothetical protein